jgi:hypothetical protein
MKHTFKALSAASLFPSAVPPSFDKEMATAHALNTARCVVNLCASFHSPTVEQENHCRETTKNKKDMSISTKAQQHNNTTTQKSPNDQVTNIIPIPCRVHTVSPNHHISHYNSHVSQCLLLYQPLVAAINHLADLIHSGNNQEDNQGRDRDLH